MRAILVILSALCAFAQEAQVVQISKPDADSAKQKYEAFVAAKAAWEQAETALKAKYNRVPADSPDAGNTSIYEPSETNITGTIVSNNYFSVGSEGQVVYHSSPETTEREKPKQPEKPRMRYRRGFESGMKFSPDFRFAVPSPAIAISNGSNCFSFPLSTLAVNN